LTVIKLAVFGCAASSLPTAFPELISDHVLGLAPGDRVWYHGIWSRRCGGFHRERGHWALIEWFIAPEHIEG
jgi:hypothetical protein